MGERYLSPNWHRYADLRPRLKSGVTISAHRYLGEIWYVLRDPVTAQHHRFTPAACRLISAMDGQTTVDAIWREALEREGEQAPPQGDIQRLLVQLHTADLIASDIAPGVSELDVRRASHARQQQAKVFKNPLTVTLPLFNPDRIVRAAARIVGAVPPLLRLCVYLAFVVPALVLGFSMRHELFANMSDRLLSFNNLILLALLTPIIKLWHEFGHGVVSRIYGGPVREFGIMLVAFYPMPYVDASASSAFPSKWRRMHVAAAGMLFEFMLAAAALYVWHAAEDGLVRTLAFNTIVIAGVSTLLINGNPLLRYDGYYIFCDVMEMPNLGQRAGRLWAQLIQRGLFGAKGLRGENLSLRERVVFLLYAPLSWLYRMVVVLGLAVFVAQQYLLPGVLIALWSLWLSVLLPLFKALRVVFVGEQLADVRGRAVGVTMLGFAALGAAALVPVPLHTSADGVVWLPENAVVRAGAPGFVASLNAPGKDVQAGAALGALENATLAGDLEVQRLKVIEAETRIAADAFGDQAKLVLLRRDLEDARAAYARAAEKAARLAIRAGASGAFMAPEAADLPGRFVTEGAVLGHIVPPSASTVRMVVTQDNIELVRGQLRDVEVRLLGDAGRSIPARLAREVPAASRELPSAALGNAGGGPFPVEPNDDKGITTLSRVFQFDVELAHPVAPKFGQRVVIKLRHDPEAIAAQMQRRARQLFLSWFAV